MFLLTQRANILIHFILGPLVNTGMRGLEENAAHLDPVYDDLNSTVVTKQLEGVAEAVKDIVHQLHGFRHHSKALRQTILNDLDEEWDKPSADYHVPSSSM